MKAYAIQSIQGTWTNEAGREAVGAGVGSSVVITNKKHSITRTLCMAPSAASRCIRATLAITGLFGIGIEEHDMAELKLKPGDKTEVKLAERSASSEEDTRSLRERMEDTLVSSGDVLEVSESEIRSSVYSVAKKLGFKVKKLDAHTIERV